MKSLNRVFLMGHLGGAPELRTSKNGNPYTRLRLATNKFMAKEDGTKDTKTDWHSVFVWGDDANRCAEYLRTGALVFVEGSLSYWEVALEGTTEKSQTGYKNAIQADRIRFITYGRGAESEDSPENLDNPAPPRNHNAVAHPVM
jgi:single-strand DNA-binding protein